MDKLQYAINAPASHGVSLDSLVDSPRYEEHLHVYVLLWDLAVKVGSMRTDACPRQRSHLPQESIPRNLRQATVCIYVPTLTELVRRDFAFKPESTAWKRLVAKTSWYVLVHVMTNACFSGAHCWKHKYAYICKYPKRNMHTYMHDYVWCMYISLVHVCVYVCLLSVCMCVCMYMHARVCVWYMCMYGCVCRPIISDVRLHMSKCVYVWMYVSMSIFISTAVSMHGICMCVCVRSVVKSLKSWHTVAVTTCSLRTAVCWSHCHCTMAWGSTVCWDAWLWQHLLGNCCGLGWLGSFLISSVDKAYWEDRGSRKLHLQEAQVGH